MRYLLLVDFRTAYTEPQLTQLYRDAVAKEVHGLDDINPVSVVYVAPAKEDCFHFGIGRDLLPEEEDSSAPEPTSPTAA